MKWITDRIMCMIAGHSWCLVGNHFGEPVWICVLCGKTCAGKTHHGHIVFNPNDI